MRSAVQRATSTSPARSDALDELHLAARPQQRVSHRQRRDRHRPQQLDGEARHVHGVAALGRSTARASSPAGRPAVQRLRAPRAARQLGRARSGSRRARRGRSPWGGDSPGWRRHETLTDDPLPPAPCLGYERPRRRRGGASAEGWQRRSDRGARPGAGPHRLRRHVRRQSARVPLDLRGCGLRGRRVDRRAGGQFARPVVHQAGRRDRRSRARRGCARRARRRAHRVPGLPRRTGRDPGRPLCRSARRGAGRPGRDPSARPRPSAIRPPNIAVGVRFATMRRCGPPVAAPARYRRPSPMPAPPPAAAISSSAVARSTC